MRHGAEDRDAEPLVGQDGGGAGKARDVAGAGRHEAGLGAMRAAQAEIDEALARRGKDHARRLGSDHRLKLQEIDHARLDELSLRQRSRDAQNRLLGKEHGSFRHRVNVTGEAHRGEIIEEVLAEPAGVLEPIELLGGKAQLLEEREHLLEAGRNQEAPIARKLAHEELENRGFGLATIQVCLHHVELVEIGQQRACRRIHAATLADNA